MHRIVRMGTLAVTVLALTAGMGGYATAVAKAPSALPVAQSRTGPGFAHHPLWLKVFGWSPNGKSRVTSSTPTGYSPGQMQSYLGLTGDGSGETIAIVDAYADPNISSDLQTFDNQFGLQAPPSFTVLQPQGAPQKNAGWALETSLDVEWAHAIAPKANIDLVEAASSSTSNLMSAISYAASQPGVVVISNSWGENEFSGETANDATCALSTAVCTFSSGDSGNPGGYPAYNPYVVAVGGTTLNLTSSGSFQSETAWSGSGGGVSQYEAKPSYQDAVNPYNYRGMPDVSYDANPSTGFAVYDSVRYQGQSGWFQVGGTSAGAPQWAAIIAAGDQLRAASGLGPLTGAGMQADTTIYGLTSGLYDVTSGTNGSCGSICTAGPGYDFVTGLGAAAPGIDTALAGSSTTVTAGASLSPSSQSATVSPGASTTYAYTLANNGTASSTFALTASSSSGWTVSASPSSVTLAAGASTTVQLSVTAGTTAGASDTETITATSGSVTASATATTTVSSPAATSASFQAAQWSTSGGKHGQNNLQLALTLDDNNGNPVSGATVAVTLYLNGSVYATGSGTTGSTGTVSFSAKHAPSGTYSVTVTSVTSTPPWDGSQPANATYSKP